MTPSLLPKWTAAREGYEGLSSPVFDFQWQRKTIDINERKEIYADFQKYLLDDAPASFLYLPYTYEISRN